MCNRVTVDRYTARLLAGLVVAMTILAGSLTHAVMEMQVLA